MKIDRIGDIIIYTAGENKKVRFVGTDRQYPKIVISVDDKREVEEVENGNL